MRMHLPQRMGSNIELEYHESRQLYSVHYLRQYLSLSDLSIMRSRTTDWKVDRRVQPPNQMSRFHPVELHLKRTRPIVDRQQGHLSLGLPFMQVMGRVEHCLSRLRTQKSASDWIFQCSHPLKRTIHSRLEAKYPVS